MSGSAKRLKAKLFEEGSAALQALGAAEDEYACPLCGQVFGREHLDSGLLTAEHVPPKVSGGKAIILTCRACNNRAGHSYDFAIARQLEVERTARILGGEDGATARLQVTTGDAQVLAQAARTDGKLEFTILGRHNNPAKVDSFFQLLSENGVEREFGIQLNGRFTAEHVRLAELKSAFLVCAAEFGYSYALSDDLRFIRDQIASGYEKTYQVRRLAIEFIPANSIFVVSNLGIVMVRFLRLAIVLPLPLLSQSEFLRIVSQAGDVSLQGAYGPIPTSFTARMDHQHGGDLSIEERPSSKL